MTKYYPGIFNEVLGPVMTGPSSSATAGPGRVGRMAGMLINDIRDIEIRFAEDGGYGYTYKGSLTDTAIVSGILGIDLVDPDFTNGYEKASERGIPVSILVEKEEPVHPNLIKISLVGMDGEKVDVEGISLGGGNAEIIKINGQSVSIKGSTTEIIFFYEGESRCIRKVVDYLKDEEIPFETVMIEDGIAQVRVFTRLSTQESQYIKNVQEGSSERIHVMDPITPAAEIPEVELSFSNSEQLSAYLKDHDMQLWEAAVMYERERTGWSEEEILAYADELLQKMRESVEHGLKNTSPLGGYAKAHAQKLKEAYEKDKWFDTGIIANACIYSVAAIESNACKGVIVAGPTAGSCGVLPGLLFSAYDTGKYTKEDLTKALMAAGLIGAFISGQATFAAEVAGCQAENGSASAMAAAAGVQLLGGSAAQAMNAASLALQHMMGLVCDEVGECAEVPCVSRNASSVSNAIVSAQLSVAGFDGVIPLDEAIMAMKNVGDLMPKELCATMLGGLCITPTGKRIEKEMHDKFYSGGGTGNNE